MDYVNICNEYFRAFSDKNLDRLSEMFHDDVYLRDWEILANGKEEVLDANKNIFDSVDKIEVITENQGLEFNGINDTTEVFNEIEIHINDGEERLVVVDIIEIELKSGLIKSVRAFKGWVDQKQFFVI